MSVVVRKKKSLINHRVCVCMCTHGSVTLKVREDQVSCFSQEKARVVPGKVSFLGLWFLKWDPTVARRFSSWMARRGKAGSCLWQMYLARTAMRLFPWAPEDAQEAVRYRVSLIQVLKRLMSKSLTDVRAGASSAWKTTANPDGHIIFFFQQPRG